MKNWNLILYKIQITRIQAEGNQWYLDNSTLPLTRSTSHHFDIILSSITRTTFCAWQVGKKNCPLQYSLSFLSNQFKYSFPLNIKQAFLLKSFCKRTLYLCCCWSEVCMMRAFPSHPVSFDFPLIASHSQELELFSIFQEGSSYQETTVYLTRLKIMPDRAVFIQYPARHLQKGFSCQ